MLSLLVRALDRGGPKLTIPEDASAIADRVALFDEVTIRKETGLSKKKLADRMDNAIKRMTDQDGVVDKSDLNLFQKISDIYPTPDLFS